MDKLTITRPDDWHLHVRNGEILQTVITHSARQFGRAIIMPNLKPPVVTVDQANKYRQEIMDCLPAGHHFEPLMTLYLTPDTTVAEVEKVSLSEQVFAFKFYPAGATTNSDAGVSGLDAAYPLFEAMQKHRVPLLIHGEVTEPDADIFDRERIFVESALVRLVRDFPELRIVLEHVTTLEAVQFVESSSIHVGATVTPQHLLYNRNAILAGGIKPHFYCLPVLKREKHRQALLKAVTSGNPKFFLGTDSAPHQTHLKENACGCAGCYSAPIAMELYAEAFDSVGRLDGLEAFASFYGPDFYGLPRNADHIVLERKSWRVPESYSGSGVSLTPLRAGEEMLWKLTE